MPLYDFACIACGHLATYLLKHGVPAICAACGSAATEKRFAPFVAKTQSGEEHVHGPGCGHDHGASHAQEGSAKAPPMASSHCATQGCDGPSPAGGCGNSYTKEVLQKYVP